MVVVAVVEVGTVDKTCLVPEVIFFFCVPPLFSAGALWLVPYTGLGVCVASIAAKYPTS